MRCPGAVLLGVEFWACAVVASSRPAAATDISLPFMREMSFCCMVNFPARLGQRRGRHHVPCIDGFRAPRAGSPDAHIGRHSVCGFDKAYCQQTCCGRAWTNAESCPTRGWAQRHGPRPPHHNNQSTRSAPMKLKTRLHVSVAAIGVAAFLAAAPAQLNAQTAVAIDADDIGGVVTGPNGPEAGVWVIAETTELPTKYAKMVVTDDQGRYVVPDLPKAKYKVWVRGYGLVDSAKVDGEPGKQLDLKATPAPNEAEAAKYYPAIYWYSMLKIPDASEFGKKDNDIPDKVKQSDWLNLMKNNGCVGCHQMGQLSTRTFPPGLGEFANHSEAWVRR